MRQMTKQQDSAYYQHGAHQPTEVCKISHLRVKPKKKYFWSLASHEELNTCMHTLNIRKASFSPQSVCACRTGGISRGAYVTWYLLTGPGRDTVFACAALRLGSHAYLWPAAGALPVRGPRITLDTIIKCHVITCYGVMRSVPAASWDKQERERLSVHFGVCVCSAFVFSPCWGPNVFTMRGNQDHFGAVRSFAGPWIKPTGFSTNECPLPEVTLHMSTYSGYPRSASPIQRGYRECFSLEPYKSVGYWLFSIT